jgi:hypothetical protein
MRTLNKFLLASAMALGAATLGASAHAATVTIWADDGDGTGLHQIATGTNFATFSGAIGGFDINGISGTHGSSPISGTDALDAISDGTGTGFLDVFVSVSGLTAPIGNFNWESSFQTEPLSVGWTLTENTWLSTANQPQSGHQIGTATMVGVGPAVNFSNFSFTDLPTGSGPYSVNTEYVLHAAGAGTANSTIDVFDHGAAPEPAAWALMLVGFGGAGALLRQRRRVAVAA